MYTMKDFTDARIAIRIPNERTVKKVMQACHDLGLKWYSGQDALDYNPNYGENYCVSFDFYNDKRITHGACSITKKKGYKIVNADEVQEIASNLAAYEITIKCCGNITTASMTVNGKQIKVATAKKHPADKFSWRVGAETAFGRLWGKEKKTARIYRIGDRVICTETSGIYDGQHGKIIWSYCPEDAKKCTVLFDDHYDIHHIYNGYTTSSYNVGIPEDKLRHE